MRHGKRHKLRDCGTEEGRLIDKTEQLKDQIRAKVEHLFYRLTTALHPGQGGTASRYKKRMILATKSSV